MSPFRGDGPPVLQHARCQAAGIGGIASHHSEETFGVPAADRSIAALRGVRWQGKRGEPGGLAVLTIGRGHEVVARQAESLSESVNGG